MRPTRSAGILAVAAVLLVAGCGTSEADDGATTTAQPTTTTETGTTGTTSTQPSTRCVQEEGAVLSYYPVSERDFCRPRVLEQREETLFSADRVTTGPFGALQFQTQQLARCEMGPQAEVVIRPDAATALRLESGTIGCQVDPGAPEIRLDTPGAVIDVRGTLFTLTAFGETTTIKVHEGSLRVRSSSDPAAAPVDLSASLQTVAAPGQPLLTGSLVGVQAEAELVLRLRLAVLTLPPEALSELAQGGTAAEGTLVTETEEQARLLDGQRLVPALEPLTTSSIQRRSAGALSAGADLAVGVGSFEALAPAFARLRQALGPEATLVYSPFSFPASSTTPDPGTTTAGTTTAATTTTTSPATTAPETTVATVPP